MTERIHNIITLFATANIVVITENHFLTRRVNSNKNGIIGVNYA